MRGAPMSETGGGGKGGTGEQQGDPGTTVGGELPEGATPVTAEWYYRGFGITTNTYNIIKYGVILYALSKVMK